MEYDDWAIKRGNPDISDNMDSPWEYYAKWNKSDRKIQILDDIAYTYGILKRQT